MVRILDPFRNILHPTTFTHSAIQFIELFWKSLDERYPIISMNTNVIINSTIAEVFLRRLASTDNPTHIPSIPRIESPTKIPVPVKTTGATLYTESTFWSTNTMAVRAIPARRKPTDYMGKKLWFSLSKSQMFSAYKSFHVALKSPAVILIIVPAENKANAPLLIL